MVWLKIFIVPFGLITVILTSSSCVLFVVSLRKLNLVGMGVRNTVFSALLITGSERIDQKGD